MIFLKYASLRWGSAFWQKAQSCHFTHQVRERDVWSAVEGSKTGDEIQEFSILVGTEQPEMPSSIDLLISLPDFMTAEKQIITIIVNHQILSETYSLDKNKDWAQMEIAIPNGLLKQGNNLITLKFSETAMPKNRND